MDRMWYKNAVIYELYVRGFQDSNGDGRGDIPGLIGRLDYLVRLGINCIWLLPIYPSPGRDDGYDISDYRGIHPDYGTMADFQRLVDEAHKRDIRIICDLVLNHTSDQHLWFTESKKGPGNPFFNYYVWSETPDKYKDARIIFKDTETSNWAYCKENGLYYWHRFFSSQPDLNYDNPLVRKEMLDVMRFWLNLGLDGFRVDAVPYLFEREGTNCENLPETHAYIREIRKMIDTEYPGRILLAEANQWPEDLLPYFGNGDEFHMAFNFPLMPRMFMALKKGSREPLEEILRRLPEIPADCQWAMFLRNHDELTLEMVTDADRDYMFSEYAKDPAMKLNMGIRRRLAPLLDKNRRKMELLNVILFSLPGTPVLYYGDEIEMGDNVFLGDRNGVRTPMHWNQNLNAGFSTCSPSRLYAPIISDPEYNYNANNTDVQNSNPDSFLNWMRNLIALRRGLPDIAMGSLEILETDNKAVFAFVNRHEGFLLFGAFNLSGNIQYARINMENYSHRTPLELFGGTEFPDTERVYGLSFSRYGYYIFRLV